MIEFREVSKTFPGSVRALRKVSCSVNDGEFVAIIGLSGAGKSTLLRLVNGLIMPDSGHVLLDGIDVTRMRGKNLRHVRLKVGMIFQQFNLVKRLPVSTNVLSGRLGRTPLWRSTFYWFTKEDVTIAQAALSRVGLAEKWEVRADALSGGQQQRTAIARALAQEANYLLADEPIASLDPPTAHEVLTYLRQLNREDGLTVLASLHSIRLAIRYADRIIGLRAGELVFDGPKEALSRGVLEDIYGRELQEEDLEPALA